MLVPKSLPLAKVLTLLAIVMVAVAVSGYLIYYNFYAESSISNTVAEVITKSGGRDELFSQPVRLPRVTGFNADFFSDPVISILKSYGQVPTTIPGKADPFAPLPLGVGSRF